MHWKSALRSLLWLCLTPMGVQAEFALRDGETVVFLGDSITAARGYTKIVEHYTLMRFPQRNVRFVNAGQGGDTASGCLQRLERDVFANGATVVTVAFGVNDIGWGMKADAEHKQRYLDGVRAIVDRCKARGVRPFICSAAITAETPDKAENGFLQKMTDEGLALAKSLGAGTIDLQRGMREIQRRILAANAKETDAKTHTRLHADDGVHLNDLGQLAMAYAMLKGLGAPYRTNDPS
jgi:lysophospholipase L1-like esterase